MLPSHRIRRLNDTPVGTTKSCVLYVMARDQRVRDNFALVAAQQQAIELGVPLAVQFVLQPQTGARSARRAREHYHFMLAGLQEVEAELRKHNVPFMLTFWRPSEKIKAVAYHTKPQAVFFDFSPLRGPQKVHRQMARELDCAVFEVDTHNIVPAWLVSDHQEIGARTLRPKINRQLADFLNEAPALQRHPHDWPGVVQPMQNLQQYSDEMLSNIATNGTDISRFKPGEKAAHAALQDFIDNRLRDYAESRNDPSKDGQSELSPYLHFGQISSATVVRAVKEAAGAEPDVAALVEEIVVRKELSDNFCLYNSDYDALAGAPEWARKTLQKHADDERDFTYTRAQFESAETHDEAWNAAQRQLRQTGKIHGYMRMYWAKKVLEWSSSPRVALETLQYLNDFYHLDGGDPNGYVGILWSIAGLHDRPWGERPVYGTVRSMVFSGLARKFDIQAYIARYPKA